MLFSKLVVLLMGMLRYGSVKLQTRQVFQLWGAGPGGYLHRNIYRGVPLRALKSYPSKYQNLKKIRTHPDTKLQMIMTHTIAQI